MQKVRQLHRLDEPGVERRLVRTRRLRSLVVGRAGDQEDPSPQGGANPSGDFVPIQKGQADVHERDMGTAGQGHANALGAIGRRLNATAKERQQEPKGLPSVRIVLDNKDF